ncbi:hypothetical protein QLX67_12485, partial [Balneolaceae bacterium ANBcel3]|nr:hypothetical protein [Balneolaceae bacterium ANBcel3]
MSHSLRGFFVCLMVLVAVTSVNGQSRVQFSGSLGLNYDTYHYSETNYSTFRPRHPANLGRFTADATLTAGRHFVLPVSIHLTTGQNTYNLPSLPDEGLVDYIRNPRNNVSINPSYRWIHGFFGSQTPMYSELTTGDIALFGVGLELDPGHFLFSINYGTSQLGVEYDPVNDIAGAYEQKIFASRIGYGRRDGTHFALNLVKATEDETSVSAASPATRPSEGITFSPLIQIRIVSDLLFRTEFAGSVYTFDILGPDMPYDNNVLDLIDPFLRVNASSNADWSKVTSLEWKGETLTLGGEVRYVGPGFQPAGYRFMERDLIDYKINSGIRLNNNRLTLNGSFGLRTNNLQNTTLDKTNRTIFNLNTFGQVTEAFSVQVN